MAMRTVRAIRTMIVVNILTFLVLNAIMTAIAVSIVGIVNTEVRTTSSTHIPRLVHFVL